MVLVSSMPLENIMTTVQIPKHLIKKISMFSMLMQAGNVNECRSRNIPLNRRYKNIRVHFKEAILSPMGPNCKYSVKHFQCCAVTQTFPHIMGSFHSHFPLSQCALYSNSQIHEYSHGRNNKHTDKLRCFIGFFFSYTQLLEFKGRCGIWWRVWYFIYFTAFSLMSVKVVLDRDLQKVQNMPRAI